MFGYLALGFFAAFAFGLISGGENSSSNSENSLFGFLKKKLFGDDGKLDKKESEDLKELRSLLKKKSEDLSPTEIRRIAALKTRLDVEEVLSERELENLDKALNRKFKDPEDGDKEITGNDEVDRLVNLNKNKTLCILQKELKNKEGDSDYDQFKELYDSVVNCAYDKDGKELSPAEYQKNFGKLLKNNSKLVDTLKDKIKKTTADDRGNFVSQMDKITDQEAKNASEQARKERVETAVINDCIEAIDNLPNTTGPIGALTDSSNQAHENVKKYFEDKGLDLDLVKSIASKKQTSGSTGNDLVSEIRNDKDIKKIVDKNVTKKLNKSNNQTSTNNGTNTNGETNTNNQTSTNNEKDEYSYKDADGKEITVKREKQDDGSYKYFKKVDDGDFEDADEQAFNTAKDKSSSKTNKTPKTNKNKKETIDDITSELVLNKDGYTAKNKNGDSVEFKKEKQNDGSYKYFMGNKEISSEKYDKILNTKIEKVQDAIKSMDEEDNKDEYEKATKFLKNAAKSLGKNEDSFIPKEETHDNKKYKTIVGPKGGKYYKVNSGSGWGDWNWYKGNHPWESISSFLKDKLIVERFYPRDISSYLQEHLK